MNINNLNFDNGRVCMDEAELSKIKLAAAELKLKKIKQLVGEKTLASNQIVEAVKEVVEDVEY